MGIREVDGAVMATSYYSQAFGSDGTMVSETVVTVDLEAGTITEVVDGGPPQTRPLTEQERAYYDPPPSLDESLLVAARLTVTDKVRAGELDDATIERLVSIYDPWQPGLEVAVGDVFQWDRTLVECIQAHTTQADWEPHLVPALWKVHRTDSGGGPIAWTAGITVAVDELVLYGGQTYKVVQAHTTQAGWEPPNTPALFELVP
jgi:hypothetical protein